MTICPGEFQSTRPVRGATKRRAAARLVEVISIHAPRAGRDRRSLRCREARQNFNPRAPCGARRDMIGQTDPAELISIHAPRAGRDYLEGAYDSNREISIHAPRAGRDFLGCGYSEGGYYFNPRAPCGARQSTKIFKEEFVIFQSTRPVRGATVGLFWRLTPLFKFQSTRPVRGATAKVYKITLHTFATKGNF